MWPICLSSLALAVLTAGIVQGTQSGQCVFKPDSVSPLQWAFIAAFELFLRALKITQCTDEHTLLKAELQCMLFMVLLCLNGTDSLTFAWLLIMKWAISHKCVTQVGSYPGLSWPKRHLPLFWKLKLKFQFRPSTVCLASLARKLMFHQLLKSLSLSGGREIIGSVCSESHMTTMLSPSQDVWTGESSKGRFLEGY